MSTGGSRKSAVGNVLRLFEEGTVAGMTEGQLLDRFVGRRDEAAFEALVHRHGPMVLGVCRRVLIDPNDVDDAFQATFLVLAKKAATIRDQQLLAHWLYGVAHRISIRARADATRRRTRERTGAWTDDASLTADSLDELAKRDLAALVQDEIAKLPEKYRMPVILCDLTGCTHEEAARRLACPIGTVKGRQARARDLLKKRLTQRGLAPSAGLLILTMTQKSTAGVVPASLVQTTIKAATLVATGQVAALGLVSAHAVILMQGAMTTMTLSTVKLAAATALAASFVVGGAAVFAQGDGVVKTGEATKTTVGAGVIGKGDQPSPVIGSDVVATTDAPEPAPKLVGNPLLKQVRKAFESTRALHAEGKASNDRVYQASMRLLDTQGATDLQAIKDHQGRMKELQAQEVDLNAKGKSNPANVDMAISYVMEANAKLAKVQAMPDMEKAVDLLTRALLDSEPPIEKSLTDQLIEQAKRSLESTLAFYDEGRITIDRLIEASAILMRAEGEAQAKSITRHVNFLKEVQKRELTELAVGRGTTADVNEVKTAVLEAQVRLAQAKREEAIAPLTRLPATSPLDLDPVAKVALATTNSYDQRRLKQAETRYENARLQFAKTMTEGRGSTHLNMAPAINAVETASSNICKSKLQLIPDDAEIPKILGEHIERMREQSLTDDLSDPDFANATAMVNRAELLLSEWLNQGKHPFASDIKARTPSINQPRSTPLVVGNTLPPGSDSGGVPNPAPSSNPVRSPFNAPPLPMPSVETGFVPATNPSPFPEAAPGPDIPLPVLSPTGVSGPGGVPIAFPPLSTSIPSRGDDPESQNPLTQATLKTLGKSVTLSMAQDTPLKDVIKFLKNATVDKDNKEGLSVYFDPVALKELEVTLDSPVSIDLPNIPIRTALKLVLSQMNLTYFVQDGVIFITNEQGTERMRDLFHQPEVLPPGPTPARHFQ